MKQNSGIMNPVAMRASPIIPIQIGATAPPTIDIMRYEDAFLVCVPSFLIDRANIVGNMIDSKR